MVTGRRTGVGELLDKYTTATGIYSIGIASLLRAHVF